MDLVFCSVIIFLAVVDSTLKPISPALIDQMFLGPSLFYTQQHQYGAQKVFLYSRTVVPVYGDFLMHPCRQQQQ